MKFLHIMISAKFMPPFIDTLKSNFSVDEHTFAFITSEKYEYGLKKNKNIKFYPNDNDIFVDLLKEIKKAKKVIIHGLWREKINKLFYDNQDLLKKVYWSMWGGDFYFPENHSKLQKFMIKNIPYLITGFKGDVDYVRRHYGAIGGHIPFFMLDCSYCKEDIGLSSKKSNSIRILVGNSASHHNCHLEALEKLTKFKDEHIEIYCPLSYSAPNHIYPLEVAKFGYENFGKKFKPIIHMMELKKYYDFLNTIDIGFFNNNRQQGFGNIITLLSLGKKIYLRKDTTMEMFLASKNIKTYDIRKDIILNKIEQNVSEYNMQNCKNHLSREVFLKNLKDFFEK